MLATGKIAFEDAPRELVRTAKNLPRLLESFERYRSELSALDLREQMAAREEELKGTRRPFRQLPEVVTWQEEHAAVSSRKKVLGPEREVSGRKDCLRSLPGWTRSGFRAELLGRVGPAAAGLSAQFARPRALRRGFAEDGPEVQEALPVPQCFGSDWL